MGSKSVLVLGIVFIFLLNVVAVHNYINDYYYQPKEKEMIKEKKVSNIDILKDLADKDEKKSIVPNTAPVTKSQKTEKENNKTEIDEDIVSYKSHYANQIASEKKSWSELFKKTKVIKKEEDKEKVLSLQKSDNSAIITLDLDINDSYVMGNPIVKKIAKRLNSSMVIKINIYKYSMKMRDYLEKVKEDFANQGVDVDDIKVIYKKDEDKKDKIKILLIKKD